MSEDLQSFMIKKGKERAGASQRSKKLTIGGLMSGAKDSKEKDGEAKEKTKTDEEILEEEELEEAKKESKGKAAGIDQTEMIKKLIIENIVKYTVIIGALVIFAIGTIELGPVLGDLLHGIIFDVLIGSAAK